MSTLSHSTPARQPGTTPPPQETPRPGPDRSSTTEQSALREGESCLTPAAVSDMLDEELDQSFPASDPPSMVQAPRPLCADDRQDQSEKAREKAHESRLLDEELEDSFPASDPPSSIQPAPEREGD